MEPDRRDLRDSPQLMALYQRFLGSHNVNVGCALNHIFAPGRWTNVDSNPSCKPDVMVQARFLTMPLGYESADAIWASHFLEHLADFEELFTVFDQFWQVLKPGGHVLAFVPHGAHDSAWEDPFHRLRFTLETFSYLRSSTYTEKGNAGYGAAQGMPTHPWEIVVTAQIPSENWQDSDEDFLNTASMQYRNVVKEIHCVMRKAGQ